MITSLKRLSKIRVKSGENDLGHIFDLITTDDQWKVCYYMSRKLGLVSSKLLIAPTVLGDLQHGIELGFLNVDRNTIDAAPLLVTEHPLSQQVDLTHPIYRWPIYPDDGGIWGAAPHLVGIFSEREKNRRSDPHLRSGKQILGMQIESRQKQIGRVSDFLIETESSVIRYFVVKKTKLLSTQFFLIFPQWIESISYLKRKVTLNLEPSLFASAPHYAAQIDVNRELETKIFAHYGMPGYWESGEKAAV